MNALTIHALDEQLSKQITRRAQEQSISKNELVKQLLSEALGIKVPAVPPHLDDFADFCGTWSEEELQAFETRVVDIGQVDGEDWK